MFWRKKATAGVDQAAKEAYFTASQGQLIWSRFQSNRTAMIAGWALVLMIVMGLFAPFLSPYDPTIAGRDDQYENGAPQLPKFWDENGRHEKPFSSQNFGSCGAPFSYWSSRPAIVGS